MRVLLVLFLVACRTQPLPEPDGGEGISCADPLYQAVPIVDFTVDDLNLCPVDLVRTTFTVMVSLCQTLGPVDVRYDAGTNTYTVRASATVDTQPCPSGTRLLTRSLALSDVARPSPGDLVMVDGNGAATLTLPVQAPLADGKCGSVGEPAACRSDYDCPPSLRCSYDLNLCVHTCFSDSDCGDDAPVCSNGICGNAPGCDPGSCEAATDCTPVGSSTACRWMERVTPGQACPCGPGALCRCGACTLPCATDGDCAGGRCDSTLGCVR